MTAEKTRIEKEAEKAVREDNAFAKSLEELIATPQWKTYESFLQRKVAEVSSVLLSELEPHAVNATHVQEYKKGTMYGLMYAVQLPSITIAAMKAISTPAEQE